MRDARLDVDEIAGLVFQDLLEAGPEFVADSSLENIKDQLEPDVNVGVSDSTRRNRGDVRREPGRPDVLRRHALLVMNPIPIAARASAANGEDAVVIFNGA